MSTSGMTRRHLLASGIACGAWVAAPRLSWAADSLVAATFPGTWNDAHKSLLVPYFSKTTGADVTLTIMLATDEVAKLSAAKGATPPFE